MRVRFTIIADGAHILAECPFEVENGSAGNMEIPLGQLYRFLKVNREQKPEIDLQRLSLHWQVIDRRRPVTVTVKVP